LPVKSAVCASSFRSIRIGWGKLSWGVRRSKIEDGGLSVAIF
jgi:hypothetical protein